MSKKVIWHQVSHQEMLARTQGLHALALGMLMRLEWALWEIGDIAADTATIARTAGVLAEEVEEHLPELIRRGLLLIVDERVTCDRIEEQRKRIDEIRRKKSEAAKKTNAKRWGSRAETITGTPESQTEAPPTRPSEEDWKEHCVTILDSTGQPYTESDAVLAYNIATNKGWDKIRNWRSYAVYPLEEAKQRRPRRTNTHILMEEYGIKEEHYAGPR